MPMCTKKHCPRYLKRRMRGMNNTKKKRQPAVGHIFIPV